ncbi:MAG: hypothetical protein NVSMB26_03090 [Beijerinckiaceae bacterium]
MPITIRDKALEERIRALAKRTGETPGVLIARLLPGRTAVQSGGDGTERAERSVDEAAYP